MKPITVVKLNEKGIETWRYEGKELYRQKNLIIIEALFNRPDTTRHGLEINNLDRFVEIFFSDRWYTVYAIHDKNTNEAKGWYCDISRPARITEQEIQYEDLALDLLVFPDGRKIVADQIDFHQLDLDKYTRNKALETIHNLKNNFFEILDSLPKVQG